MGVLAEIIDHMLAGEVAQGAEMAMQMFKSLEMFALTGSWDLGHHLELSRPARVTCITSREKELARSTPMMEERLSKKRE